MTPLLTLTARSLLRIDPWSLSNSGVRHPRGRTAGSGLIFPSIRPSPGKIGTRITSSGPSAATGSEARSSQVPVVHRARPNLVPGPWLRARRRGPGRDRPRGAAVHHHGRRTWLRHSGPSRGGPVLRLDADVLPQQRRPRDRRCEAARNARQADQRGRRSGQGRAARALTLPYPASNASAKSSEGPAWPADSSAVWVRANARWAASWRTTSRSSARGVQLA